MYIYLVYESYYWGFNGIPLAWLLSCWSVTWMIRGTRAGLGGEILVGTGLSGLPRKAGTRDLGEELDE